MNPTRARSLTLVLAVCALAVLVAAPGAGARTMVVQPDGKVVLAGYGFPGFGAMVRYDADGSLDPSFGRGGVAYDRRLQPLGDLVLQPDGRIVASASRLGSPQPAWQVGRYLANGKADTSFGSGGVTFSPVEPAQGAQAAGLLVRPDGSVVAGFNHCCFKYFGSSASVALFSPGGSYAGSLGQLAPHSWPGEAATLADVLEQPGGALIGVGHAIRREGVSKYKEGLALVRFLPGTTAPDPAFGNGEGIVLGPASATATTVASDEGKLLVGAYDGFGISVAGSRGLVARFDGNGVIDSGFGSGGYTAIAVPGSASAWVTSFAVAADGSIFAVGTTYSGFDPEWSYQPCAGCAHPFVAKLTPAGQPDPSFGAGGVVVLEGGAVPSMTGGDVAVLADGRVLVSGETGASENPGAKETRGFALARLAANGQLDPSFGQGGVATTVTCGGSDKQRRASGCLPTAKVSLQVGHLSGPRPWLRLRVRPNGSWAQVDSVQVILPKALTVSEQRVENGAGFRAVADGHEVTPVPHPHSLNFSRGYAYAHSLTVSISRHALKPSRPFPPGKLRFRVLVKFGEPGRYGEGEQTVVLNRRG